MRIAEIYQSRQGEGFLTGTDSVFVRTSGCNLRCWFCDTPYTSWTPEGEDLSVGEILNRVDPLTARHVVVTGGEPMLFAELVPLTSGLRQRGLHITIETAGTLDLPVECDLMSISPKLAGSGPRVTDQTTAAAPVGLVRADDPWLSRHEQTRHAPEVIRSLVDRYTYQFKFVVDEPNDCVLVEAYLRQFPTIDRSRVMLMPQGTDPKMLARQQTWLEPYCQQHRLPYCPRMHIEWYGWTRGT